MTALARCFTSLRDPLGPVQFLRRRLLLGQLLRVRLRGGLFSNLCAAANPAKAAVKPAVASPDIWVPGSEPHVALFQ